MIATAIDIAAIEVYRKRFFLVRRLPLYGLCFLSAAMNVIRRELTLSFLSSSVTAGTFSRSSSNSLSAYGDLRLSISHVITLFFSSSSAFPWRYISIISVSMNFIQFPKICSVKSNVHIVRVKRVFYSMEIAE